MNVIRDDDGAYLPFPEPYPEPPADLTPIHLPPLAWSNCAACGAPIAPIAPDATLCGPCEDLQDGDGIAVHFAPEPPQ